MKPTKVVIVGGGSSGWITAAYLNGALNKNGLHRKIDITLIESPDIPNISVGEATVISIKHTLAVIGIDELEFMQATDATFKQAIKYVNWVENDNSHYYHPFNRFTQKPIDRAIQFWLASDKSIPFVDTCSAQAQICELGLSPQTVTPWNLGTKFNAAYHMDAQKFAKYLASYSIAKGVKYISANVTDVELKDNEHISCVKTDHGQTIDGDLFIDCTGFRAKLIGETLNVGYEDFSQWLFCDQAVTMHVPYESHFPGEIRPYTTATALSNGWIWDIPMQHQRSIGYVHSSQYISEEQADLEMRAYQGAGCEDLPSRTVKFKVGRRHKHWHGNCIAIGLSGGFIEPLESTGLHLSELSAVLLAEHFPYNPNDMENMAFRFNRILSNRYYEVLDFINMHYCLTKRNDTLFWQTVQKSEHITDRLKAKFDFWKIKPPSPSDFEDQSFLGFNHQSVHENLANIDHRAPVDTGGIWNHNNYLFILYSMGFEKMAEELYGDNLPPTKISPRIQHRLNTITNRLPTHQDWLIQKLGLRPYKMNKRPAGWT